MEDYDDCEQTLYFTLGTCNLLEYAEKLACMKLLFSPNDLIYCFLFLNNFVLFLYENAKLYHGDIKNENCTLVNDQSTQKNNNFKKLKMIDLSGISDKI